MTTYEAGPSWSELPGDRHRVSANASETRPATVLAVFVVDTNETELTIPFGNCGGETSLPDIPRRHFRLAHVRFEVTNDLQVASALSPLFA